VRNIPTSASNQLSDEDEERRVYERDAAAPGSLVIDLGFGPATIINWSLGGARIQGTSLALAVGDFASGEIALGDAKGPFIADVVRVEPPYFDPRHPPHEISLRWLDLPPDIVSQMIAAKSAP